MSAEDRVISLREFVDEGAHVCADGGNGIGSSLDCVVCQAAISEGIACQLRAHIDFLEDTLGVVLVGFDRALDRLEELGDDESAGWIWALMEEHGVQEILARELPA